MEGFWESKRVLLTGHTGFKGVWLSQYLISKGAEIHGISLPPATSPSLFECIKDRIGFSSSHLFDISNFEKVAAIVEEVKPEIVFHLAAQPLVLEAAKNPLETIRTNVLGTAHVLEAVLRKCPEVRGVVVVTTDKVYENKEWNWGYRENDSLGGNEIYSASKAAADTIATIYGKFFARSPICTVRAGNVIGGGDWSDGRLIPDIIRAWRSGETLEVRAPNSIRPWQHVLEPTWFYANMAELLSTGDTKYARSWNWGPEFADALSVREICNRARKYLDFSITEQSCNQNYEASILRLDCSLAKSVLGTKCSIDIEAAIDLTFSWYKNFYDGKDPLNLISAQIEQFDQIESCTTQSR